MAAPRPAFTLVLAFSLVGAPGLAGCLTDLGSEDGLSRSYDATVRWTSHGIPHVEADGWGGLGYGYGFAAAQDYLCTIAEEYVTVAGNRSEHFGPNGTYGHTSGQTYTNLESDLFHTLTDEHREIVDSATDHPDERLQSLIDGYVDGYNRYLDETPASQRPADCRGEDWVRPIAEEDVRRRFDKLSLLASSGFFGSAIVAAQPPGSGGSSLGSADLRQTEVAPLAERLPTPQAMGVGSNGYAFGSESTANDRGMLLGNPHFPWSGPERFHQLHLTIPGQVDVMGATLLGIPLVLIGFTEAFAWTHTVSTGWRFSLHELTLAPEDPTAYVVDGEVEQMETRDVQLEIGERTVEHTFYFSRYGPVIDFPLAGGGLPGPGDQSVQAGLTWEQDRAYALNDTMFENDRSAIQFLRWATADSFDEFISELEQTQGIPWVNTIAASPDGRAFYGDISVVPNYDADKIERCNTPVGQALFQQARLPVFDGSRSECTPTEDPAAAQPGIIPAEELPSIATRDWLINSNDDYWIPNPEHRLTGFSPMIGWGEACPPDACERSTRTRMGYVLFEEREAGDDFACELDPEVPCEEMTLDRLEHSLFANRLYVPEHELDAILEGVCTPSAATSSGGEVVDLSQACQVLADWDRRAEVDSAGLPLFELFWLETPKTYSTPFDPSDPVHTPRGFVAEDPRVRTALADALVALESAGIPVDATAGEARSVEHEGERIPLHGARGQLGSPSMLVAPFEEGEGFAEPVHGNSYVQAVTWDEQGTPVAEALLTYSQSPHEDSPHHVDQTRLYSNQQWVRLPFTDEQIEADPNVQVRELAS